MYLRHVSNRGHRTRKSYESALIALLLSYPQAQLLTCFSFKSGGVAESVRAPNSNRKVANSMTTLMSITRCCVVGKDIFKLFDIQTSDGVALCTRTQVGSQKVVDSQFGS